MLEGFLEKVFKEPKKWELRMILKKLPVDILETIDFRNNP